MRLLLLFSNFEFKCYYHSAGQRSEATGGLITEETEPFVQNETGITARYFRPVRWENVFFLQKYTHESFYTPVYL